ncbi:tripartite tricarboxylate transporter TctB family protein [Nocardiopsis lambiniae]|uniref:Tripartite tricarboxylate transporter TctB family protein n=1 Tax=Nocardiopsis lambiniae TaxID=3075539 RepID=A0ABU2MFH2_9ACTN|nr:tripartite tricarboxylate transporter TctB family protein [Nocardiopsis sp. DSM 44743]MDT0331348.1 tripartite tricarboxylate transporter TctB family protein [Nocardiopsis sp. DSM 44743]
MTVNETEKGAPVVTEPGETTAETAEAAAARAAAETATPDPETAPWSGPARWAVPALAAAVGLVMLWGAFTIEAPTNATKPGPGFVPGVIGALLLVAAVSLVVTGLRGRTTGVSNTLAWFETRPVLIVLAGLVAHIVLLEFLGWLLSGALLFWAVAFAFGARAYVRDAVVALSVSAAVQVGFSLGLGLSLPAGILGWGL